MVRMIWIWQNPIPQGNSLEGVKMLCINTIIAVGEVSTIIKGSDGGITWNLQHRVTNSDRSNKFKVIVITYYNFFIAV